MSKRTKKITRDVYPTGNNNTSNHRKEGSVGKEGFSCTGHQVSENRSEKRRRGTHGLIKGDGEILEGNVAADDGEAEDETQRGYLEELHPRPDGLHWGDGEPRNGEVAERRTSQHVTESEEDRVAESVVAEQVFVE